MERWVFLNNDFYLEEHAAIPINDRGFLFGEGIFTTIRVCQGKCELFKSHMQRLQQQAKVLNFHLDFLHTDWIFELIQRNQAREGTWRLKIIITVKQEQKVRTVGCLLATLYPYENKVSNFCDLCLFPHVIDTPFSHIKSLSYLSHLYVRDFAHQRGYEDAIIQTKEGFLLETGCSNLFWIDQGKCWIPDPQLPYLKGVFLQSILSFLRLPTQFIKATIDQLPASAHVYICNALTHVRPVLSIGCRTFVRSQEKESMLQQAIVQALQGNE